MNNRKVSRPVVPPGFVVKLLLPFATPVAVTLLLVVLVGEAWPRNIAPGSGLKLTGFIATAITSLMVWRVAVTGIADRWAHRFAALLAGVTGLMGWPVWSVGVLPSVNGARLGPAQTVAMALERTEISTVSRSRRLNHWAWLHPASPDSPAAAGRYFIPEDAYSRWNETHPRSVRVTIASGLLGAQVVTGFE